MRDNGGGEICAWRCVGHLLPKILPPMGRAGSDDPGGVSTHRSWGCRKISLERQVVSTVVVAPERLCDYCNATGVGHDRWMGCRN